MAHGAPPLHGGAKGRRQLWVLLMVVLLVVAWAVVSLRVPLSPRGYSTPRQQQGGALQYAQSKLVVLAVHNHTNTSWASDVGERLGFPVAVYDNTRTKVPHEVGAGVQSGGGDEARSYLAAIIEHYDDLPDAVVFMHGHEISWHTTLGDESNNSVWKLEHMRWPLNESYAALACQERPVMHIFCEDARFVSECSGNPARWFRQAWLEHFRLWLGIIEVPTVVANACCAEFLVTREAIQQYPKQFYMATITWMDETNLPKPGWVMEHMWHILFSRRHRGVHPWAFMREMCLCYMYGLECDTPQARGLQF